MKEKYSIFFPIILESNKKANYWTSNEQIQNTIGIVQLIPEDKFCWLQQNDGMNYHHFSLFIAQLDIFSFLHVISNFIFESEEIYSKA